MKRLLLRLLLFFVLFAGVPLGIAGFLGLYAISIEEDYRRELASKELDDDLSNIGRHIDPKGFVRIRFTRLARRLFQRPITSRQFKRLWDWTCNKWGFVFEPYLFDPTGKLITPNAIPLKSRYMIQKLWTIVRDVHGTRDADLDKYKIAFTPLFGPGFRITHLDACNGFPHAFSLNGQKGILFWKSDPHSKFGGVFFIASQIPSAQDLLRWYAQRPLRQPLALLAGNLDGPQVNYWEKLEPQVPEKVWRHFQTTQEASFFFHDRAWASMEIDNLFFLAGRTKDDLEMHPIRRLYLQILLLCGFLAAIFWFRWMVWGKALYVSIRVKLILLFLFSVLVPLMGLSFLGFRLLKDRQVVLTTQVHKAAKDALIRIDSDFPREKIAFLRLGRSVRDDPNFIVHPASFSRRIDHLFRQSRLFRCDILDTQSKILFTLDRATTKGRIGYMMTAMAKLNIERHIPERVPAQNNQSIGPMDVVAREVFENPEMGYLDFISLPDAVHSIQFGSQHLNWVYWDVFHDRNHPAAYLHIYQSIDKAQRLFLNKRLSKRVAHLQGGFRFFAHQNDTKYWFPRGTRPTPEMENILQRVLNTQQQVQGRFHWRGKAFLALGFPGKNLFNHALLALFPEDEITGDIARHKQWGLLLVLAALLVSTMIGFLLSETFLTPIAELSKGIQALREKDHDYRVPEIQKDELGDLSLLFNHMMEDVTEMQVAKVVQDSLIPREAPQCPTFDFEVFNITASDLGGDYCDVLPMKDGRLLLVIGDVTGHGVSAALLMAMAKSAVFFFAQDLGSPKDLLIRLNTMVTSLMKRKKLMTFFAAILDPKTGDYSFSNAGHPYPLLLKADGTRVDLEMVHYPLGLQSKGKFQDKAITIQPGETLIMYTDGLVETADATGKQLGYARFRETAHQLKLGTPQEIRQGLMAMFENHHGPGAPDDDVTLIILKRKSPPPEPRAS